MTADEVRKSMGNFINEEIKKCMQMLNTTDFMEKFIYNKILKQAKNKKTLMALRMENEEDWYISNLDVDILVDCICEKLTTEGYNTSIETEFGYKYLFVSWSKGDISFDK